MLCYNHQKTDKEYIMENIITVSKTVSDKTDADTVEIKLTALGENKKYAAAVSTADEKADKVVALLKNSGFTPELRGITVSDIRDDKRIVAFRAARVFSVRFDADAETIGRALDVLDGSDCEWHISFSLKNDNPIYDRLLACAVKSAKDSAEVIASASGVKLGRLRSVNYESGERGYPVAMFARAASGMNGADAERITVSQSVTCSWEIV